MMSDAESVPTTVTSLVAYQEGSVVSRIVAKTAGGSLTVFAFDEGQSLSEHTVPHPAVLHVLDGVASVTIGGTRHRIAAGELIALPEDVPHAVEAPVRFKMALIMLRH